jgi:hypothetical protein
MSRHPKNNWPICFVLDLQLQDMGGNCQQSREHEAVIPSHPQWVSSLGKALLVLVLIGGHHEASNGSALDASKRLTLSSRQSHAMAIGRTRLLTASVLRTARSSSVGAGELLAGSTGGLICWRCAPILLAELWRWANVLVRLRRGTSRGPTFVETTR